MKHEMIVIENGTMRICVQPQEYRGKQYLDVRNYYTDKSGELKPTQKGVMIPESKVAEVLAAMTTLHSGSSTSKRVQEPIYAVCESARKNVTVSKQFAFKTFAKARTCLPEEDDSSEPRILKCSNYERQGDSFRMRDCEVVAKWNERKGTWVRP